MPCFGAVATFAVASSPSVSDEGVVNVSPALFRLAVQNVGLGDGYGVDPAAINLTGQQQALSLGYGVTPAALAFDGQDIMLGEDVIYDVDAAGVTFGGQEVGLIPLIPSPGRGPLLTARSGLTPGSYWRGKNLSRNT